MRTLKVRLTNPELKIDVPRALFGPLRKVVITGDMAVEVPSSSFWRRRIREGDLEIVTAKAAPPSEPMRPEAATSRKPKKKKIDEESNR